MKWIQQSSFLKVKNGLSMLRAVHIVNGMVIKSSLLIGKMMDMKLGIILMRRENRDLVHRIHNVILKSLLVGLILRHLYQVFVISQAGLSMTLLVCRHSQMILERYTKF